jgi:hypothetical protein
VGSGTLVLGVWGIRAVMLASNIGYTTMVDLSLALILLFLLGGITLRVLLALCERNRLRLPGRLRGPAAWRAAAPPPAPIAAAPPLGSLIAATAPPPSAVESDAGPGTPEPAGDVAD